MVFNIPAIQLKIIELSGLMRQN